MTVNLILRIMAASMESLVLIAEKATPDQVQKLVERHNARMERCEALLERIKFWDRATETESPPA